MYEEFVKYLKSYKPRELIIKEGSQDTEFYCLLQGSVGIWKGGDPDSGEGMIKVGEISEKGSYFGEMSSLIQEERSASIISNDQVKVLRFPGSMLSSMMLKQPKLALKLCQALADRLQGTTTQHQSAAQERNEMRADATTQLLDTKLAFQKLFVMLSALQAQLQNPNLKGVVEWMTQNKLIQGGRKIRIDEEFLADIPEVIIDQVKRVYSDMLVT